MAKRLDDQEIYIERLVFGGKGLGKLPDGRAVFVERTAPGDTALVRFNKVKKDYCEGYPLEIKIPSEWRIQPRCPHFLENCGGCAWQHLAYKDQLAYKEEQFKESLRRLGGLEVEVKPIAASENEWYYRNKMEYSFGESFEAPSLGLHRKGSWMRIVKLEQCFLMAEFVSSIVRKANRFIEKSDYPVWNPKHHTGFWRHLILREGENTGDKLAVIVANEWPETQAAELVKILEAENINHIQWGLCTSLGGSAPEQLSIIKGKDKFEEVLGGKRFLVSPTAFFQTNTRSFEKLLYELKDQLELQGNENILDLYCGLGSIGIFLAEQASKVTGIEINPQAILDAEVNAELNMQDNTRFIAGEAEKILPDLSAAGESFDAVIADPPRAGLHPKVLETLISLKPRKIAYVSCNPATLARDLKELTGAGYQVAHTRPFDLFPQTYHIESLTILMS